MLSCDLLCWLTWCSLLGQPNKLQTWRQVIQFSKHYQFCVWRLVLTIRSNNYFSGLSFSSALRWSIFSVVLLKAMRVRKVSLKQFSLPYSVFVHNKLEEYIFMSSLCHKLSAKNRSFLIFIHSVLFLFY